MNIVTSAELQRKLGEIQDRALREPVTVTHHGRPRLVILSAEEYRRLRRRDRQTLPVDALSPADLVAIARAEAPAAYAPLDRELDPA
jgi:prevent-host-death family protein